MARKGKAAEGGEATTSAKDSEGKGKGKGKLVPAVVLAVGLAGGGYFMAGKGGGAPAAADAPPTTTTTVPGPVVPLAPITLNMSDGRYLKVGIALQLESEATLEEAGDDDPTKGYARVLDTAIQVLGGRTFQELVSTEGREAAKQALTASLQQQYAGEIEGVYFTEFVMQ